VAEAAAKDPVPPLMRYGVISDVHGNAHALDAVLRALEPLAIDRLICPGDLVGYGPRPSECVERVAALDPIAVAGNHDLMAVGRLPMDGLGTLPRQTLEWTREMLSVEARSYLERLPLTAEADDGTVVVAHGSLADPADYVQDRAAAAAQLSALVERFPGARTMLLGHTHRPLAVSADGAAPAADGEVALADHDRPWLLNAGSVGQARERRPLARALVLDTERATASFIAVSYDVRATRQELREAGLPPHACHLAPGRPARWRRRLAARLQPA
jgi:predicted phosphodiesterase